MTRTRIQKIKFTKEQLAEIDKINKGELVPTVRTRIDKNGIKRDIITNHRFTYETGKKRLREFYGGICCICGELPDYRVLYDEQGAKRIERYCQKDFDIFRDRIK